MCPVEAGLWPSYERSTGRLGGGGRDPPCPVSLDLARQHAADLRRTRFAETASSWSSHFNLALSAVLSVVSHSIWSAAGGASRWPPGSSGAGRTSGPLAEGPGTSPADRYGTDPSGGWSSRAARHSGRWVVAILPVPGSGLGWSRSGSPDRSQDPSEPATPLPWASVRAGAAAVAERPGPHAALNRHPRPAWSRTASVRLTWAVGQVAGGWARWWDRRGGVDPTTTPEPRRRRRPRRRRPARS